jgi:hypothetical protein
MTNASVKKTYLESAVLAAERLRSHRFEGTPPFMSLSPRFERETDGYWRKRVFARLIRDVGLETMMHHAMVSSSTSHTGPKLENVVWQGLLSQQFGFDIIRNAITGGKLVARS